MNTLWESSIVALQLEEEAVHVSAVMPWKVNSYTWRVTASYMLTGSARVGSLAFCTP